jgi:hypothetical protein
VIYPLPGFRAGTAAEWAPIPPVDAVAAIDPETPVSSAERRRHLARRHPRLEGSGVSVEPRETPLGAISTGADAIDSP